MAKEAEPFKGAKDLERMAMEIDHGGDPNADLNAVDTDVTKAEAGLTLKMSGASYTTIAKTLGYSSAYRARMAVERVLASAANSPEDREKMRVLTSRRLNRLLQSVMGKALDPADSQHLAYNARALAIVDREARLWGVDAPTQVQITATDEQIQEYARRMSGLAQAALEADEADIIDADVVEGEL